MPQTTEEPDAEGSKFDLPQSGSQPVTRSATALSVSYYHHPSELNLDELQVFHFQLSPFLANGDSLPPIRSRRSVSLPFIQESWAFKF